MSDFESDFESSFESSPKSSPCFVLCHARGGSFSVIEGLLTSFARSVRESICPADVFVRKNPKANTFPYRPTNEVKKYFIISFYMAFGSFSSLFLALCSSSDVRDVAVYVTY